MAWLTQPSVLLFKSLPPNAYYWVLTFGPSQ